MTFYIKPPGGNISLSSLYKDAETRLLFLCQLEQCWGDMEEVQRILSQHPNIAANSDCLIEGSHKDRSSHYVLRLACLGNGQFQSFLMLAESQFFEYRLYLGEKAAVKSTVLTLLRHVKYALKHLKLASPYHEQLLQIKEASSEVLAADMLDCGKGTVCSHQIKVPWILAENLVKGRHVIVTRGKAEVQCEHLMQLLCSVFRKTLEYGIRQLSESDEEESFFHDPRMVQVKKSLCKLFRRQYRGGGYHVSLAHRILRHQEIESQVQYFPLCMQSLHRTLVKNNRLRHHARFRYTLFLKDIGVPWQENVAFWEHYYSRPHSGAAAGCCHTWKGNDGHRYTYGIRHLYGMEGGKKNYTSHSCSALQEMKPQPQEPGGCPFTSQAIEDIIHLSPRLHDTPHIQQAIAKEMRTGRPNSACKILLGYTKLISQDLPTTTLRVIIMKSAWESQNLQEGGVDGGGNPGGDSDVPGEGGSHSSSSCCCHGCGTFCKIFLKYTIGRSLQLTFYILDIATDVGVAYTDYIKGDIIFASITLGLVFAPGLLFALFAFTQVLMSHTGILACIKAPLWLIGFPFLPLWPIFRDLHQIYHGVMALFPANRKYHLAFLNKPSRAYLLKFLEAFVEAAPQILLRLYKITLRKQEMPFSKLGPLEIVQVSFSLVTLANKLISTQQKTITTQQIINGDIDNSERFRLPCLVQLLGFLWWSTFLVARFEVMAIFAGSLKWWIFVVIGVHVVLVFLFQTLGLQKHGLQRIFIYLFSAFVFIFAYIQFNMQARIKVTVWLSYTVYSILVLLENSVMLVVWYFAQEVATANYPEEDQLAFASHRQLLIYIHYGVFSFSMLMLVLTFWCAPNFRQNKVEEDEEEMKAIRVS
ncbi:hypothetical protein Pcinc_036833 [Petrolisthes cinctipes]|uniref:XK-related protein n=1 Tax=Petrolisthes cinctipes TaxID=88211 RepID=A0AAE1BTS9_PETCI|nr:hypothetical protein Pcinc_036833 [Petrolisthes cinctipes]